MLPPAWADLSPVQFRHITPQNGLPHNFVLDIMQDRDGVIWLATAAGLSRYDGVSFYNYTAGQDKKGLQGNFIVALMQDRKGGIWIGTKNNGLSHLDPATQIFTHFEHDPATPASLSSNSIANRAIYEDVQGTIWVGTEQGGLNAIDPETGKITRYSENTTSPWDLGSDGALSIAEQPRSHARSFLWVGTHKGLAKIDLDTNKVRHYSLSPMGKESVDIPVHTVYVQSERIIWAGTTQGLLMLDSTTGQQTFFRHSPNDPATLSHNTITDIQAVGDGTLWIATLGGGLNRLDPTTGNVARYKNDVANNLSLAGDQLSCLMMDTTGILWIGTHGLGLDYLDPQLQNFSVYRPSANSANALANELVLDVFLVNNSKVWLGTGGGLNKFDPQTQSFTTYNVPANNFVHNVFVDSQGTHWIGTWGAGIYQFDPTTEVFTPFRLEGMDINRCFCFFEDITGQLWVGTGDKGLYVISPDRQSFQQLATIPNQPNSLSNNLVHRVMQDSRGTIWIATLHGLNRYRPKTNDFVRYLRNHNNQNSLSDNSVKNILEDSSGKFWLTTDNGLNHFDPLTGNSKAYFQSDGLPHNRTDSIEQDNSGMLWIGTPKGLCRFDPVKKQFQNFDYRDGLQGNVFNLVAKKDSNGILYFSGTQGLQRFNPESVKPNPHKPPVILTDFTLHDRPENIKNDKVSLSYQDNVFTIAYAALNYTIPEKNRYSYKLIGFDKDWTETGERSIRYTNLNPGQYTFRVKGSNNDKIWNETGASIQITITPPWWQMWWARGALLLALVILIGNFIKWRTFRLQRKNRFLEMRVNDRTLELVQANKDLKSSQERYQCLSDAAFEGIVLSEKGKIVESNERFCQMFGYLSSELVGKHIVDMISAEERAMVETRLQSDEEQTYEVHAVHKDGTILPIEVNAKMFTYKDQQVRVTAIRDLTEQKKAEEEIKTLQGFLPICSVCKNIRDDQGYWNQIETYISNHSEVQFSHGVCEKCVEDLYSDQDWYQKMTSRKS